MSNIDFTKPIQVQIPLLQHNGITHSGWVDVTYIGQYQGKHVIADSDGDYHTVYEFKLRNTPVKPTTKQLYDSCVEAALTEGFGWANQQKTIELIYEHLVLNGLIKEES